MMQLAQWSIDHPDEVTKPWSRAAIKSLIVAYVADLYESSTVLSPESRVLSP